MENLRMTTRKSLVSTACIFVACQVLLLSALIALSPPVAALKSSRLRSAHKLTTTATATTTSSNDIIDGLVLLRNRQLPAVPVPYRRLQMKYKTPKKYDDDEEEDEEGDYEQDEYGEYIPPPPPDDEEVGDMSPSSTTNKPTQYPTFSATLFPSPSPPPTKSPSTTSTSTTTDGGGNDDLDDNNSTDASIVKSQLVSLPLLSYTMSVTSSSTLTDNGSDNPSLSAMEVVKAAESVFISGLSLAFRNVVSVELEGTILQENDDDDRRTKKKKKRGLLQQQRNTNSLFTTSSLSSPADDEQQQQSSSTNSGSMMTLVMEIVGDVAFESKESDQSDVPSLTTLQAAQRALLLNVAALENDLQAALLQNSGGGSSSSTSSSSSASDMILKVNYIKVSDSGGGTSTIVDGNNVRSPGDNEGIESTVNTNANDNSNTTVMAVALTASSMVVVAAGLLIFQRKRQLEADCDSNSMHSAVQSDDASSSSAAPSHTSSLTNPSAFPTICATAKPPPNEREQDNKKQRRFEGHASSSSSPPKTSAKTTKDENRRSERKTAAVPSDISVSSSDSSTSTEEHVNTSMPPSGTGGGDNSGQRPSRSARRSSRRRRRRRGSSAGSHHSMSSAGNCTLTSVVEEEEAEEVVVDVQDEQIEMYSPPDPPEDGRPEEPTSPDPPSSTNAIQTMMTTSLAAAAAQRSSSPRSRETHVDIEESAEGPETPKTSAAMSWGERVRSNVGEPAGFIYALADALTQSQQKANGKAATPDMPKTPTRKSQSQWHSPQSKEGGSSGGREPVQEAPNSPYDEQETDLCDACDIGCSPSSPTDGDDVNPVLGRVSSLFTPYGTASANPRNQEDDGNVTDHSSGSSTAGDRLVKSIFKKTRYFSKEQKRHHAEEGFTSTASSSSESGAISPALSPKRPGTLMILQQPLDNSYYMHSKALADDESDEGAAAEDRALISPSLFLERSTGGKTTNRRFSAASFVDSSKGCSNAAAKSTKGCSGAESKGSSSKSSKSMPTDEEESYRNMDIVGFVDPVVQATRSAQSNKNQQQQQQQPSKKPAFPGYSRLWLGSKKAGATNSPSGMQNVMVYPDAVIL